MKVIIIGSGLCGLSLGQKLKNASIDVVIYEKSRGVGGRFATRRFGTDKMDHGNQSYTLEAPIHDLHSTWSAKNLVAPWAKPNTFTSSSGMTALAKHLAEGLDIYLNERVIKIEEQGEKIHITAESGRSDSCDQLVITSPVPQSIDLLDSGAFSYVSTLKDVSYSPMIVLFVRNAVALSAEPFILNPTHDIYSIADQQSKSLSLTPAWTLTLSPRFSSLHFEKSDAEILQTALPIVQSQFQCTPETQIEVKKWRYALPFKPYFDKFYKPHAHIYLAGDAFGGNDLLSSLTSAQAVYEELVHAKNHL